MATDNETALSTQLCELWDACLEVMQHIAHAGSAAECHNDGALIPGNEHLARRQVESDDAGNFLLYTR